MSDLAPPAVPAPAPATAEVPSCMEQEAALLAAISEVTTIQRAVMRPQPGSTATDGGIILTAYLQQRNLPANAQRKYTVNAALLPPGAGPARALVALPQELPADTLLTSISPSGQSQLIVRNGGGDTTSMVLQVWRGARMALELHVPKSLHGGLINDGYFASGVAWSPDESAVAYVAEGPPSEKTPAWCGPESLKDAAGPKSWRGVGAAAEDWGELNTGKRPPAIWVLDQRRKEVVKVTGLPAEHSFGQPTWCPGPGAPASPQEPVDGVTGLVVVGWPHRPPPSLPGLGAGAGARKLGTWACYNRSAHMYHVPLARGEDGAISCGGAHATRLAPSLDSALSPLFSPAGDHLVFVSHQTAVDTGTHAGTARLYRLDWPAPEGAEPQLLVGVVERPQAHDAFPGLYTASLPDDGFVGLTTLLLNSQWRSQAAILAVDTARPQPGAPPRPPVPVTPIVTPSPGSATGATGGASWTLLAAAAGTLLACRVAPDSPPALMVSSWPAAGVAAAAAKGTQGLSLEWRELDLGLSGGGRPVLEELPEAARNVLAGLECRVLPITPSQGDATLPCEALVWMSKDRKGPLPCLVVPHGGPHTAITLGWYPPYAFLAALGYCLISPNYRGSTGYGQAALGSLPGRIGRQDVTDCMDALAAAVAAGYADPSRASVIGGSHGGFLSAHLVGRYPRAFRCGVLRNPVTNISAMAAASDIPDWCYVEVMGCEEGKQRCKPVPTPEDLAAMYAASPTALVGSVRAPMLLVLGAKDRRVPPLDGLQYYAALRAQPPPSAGAPGAAHRVLVFPEDTHGLDKPQTEYEQWVNTAWWVKQHTAAVLPQPETPPAP